MKSVLFIFKNLKILSNLNPIMSRLHFDNSPKKEKVDRARYVITHFAYILGKIFNEEVLNQD